VLKYPLPPCVVHHMTMQFPTRCWISVRTDAGCTCPFLWAPALQVGWVLSQSTAEREFIMNTREVMQTAAMQVGGGLGGQQSLLGLYTVCVCDGGRGGGVTHTFQPHTFPVGSLKHVTTTCCPYMSRAVYSIACQPAWVLPFSCQGRTHELQRPGLDPYETPHNGMVTLW
jgi:hypothetical protein